VSVSLVLLEKRNYVACNLFEAQGYVKPDRPRCPGNVSPNKTKKFDKSHTATLLHTTAITN